MVDRVFSLSGAVVRENLDRIEDLKDAFDSERQNVFVTGAGDLSEHVKAVKNVANSGEQDLVGIQATRLNAKTFATAIDAYPVIPNSIDELEEACLHGEDVVMGGLTPGYSTDAVAAITAELLDAELFIATRVDGVYDPHPDHSDAAKLETVTVQRLRDILGKDNEPGSYELIDSTALDIIERSDISTKIFELGYENLDNPDSAEGTEIKF